MSKIYLASSWRNPNQPEVLATLRKAGHEVYDFRNPTPGNAGFSWSEIDYNWQDWDASKFRQSLDHPLSQIGYSLDWNAMKWADTGVLLLPCGRSAHLEAGYFVGAGKRLVIMLAGKNEPELMYKMADRVVLNSLELLDALK